MGWELAGFSRIRVIPARIIVVPEKYPKSTLPKMLKSRKEFDFLYVSSKDLVIFSVVPCVAQISAVRTSSESINGDFESAHCPLSRRASIEA